MRGAIKMMTLAGLIIAADYEKFYRDPILRRNYSYSKPMSEEEKKRIHDNYQRQFHIFNINGVEISAKSKKDAKKIYERRIGYGKNDRRKSRKEV